MSCPAPLVRRRRASSRWTGLALAALLGAGALTACSDSGGDGGTEDGGSTPTTDSSSAGEVGFHEFTRSSAEDMEALCEGFLGTPESVGAKVETTLVLAGEASAGVCGYESADGKAFRFALTNAQVTDERILVGKGEVFSTMFFTEATLDDKQQAALLTWLEERAGAVVDDSAEWFAAHPEDAPVEGFADGVEVPSTADGKGGIVFGKGGAVGPAEESGALTVDLYFDFRCPGCAEFEKINGAALKARADAGEIRLVLHPVSFLDSEEAPAAYSTRAAAAFAYVAENAPEQAFDFHVALFENQPVKGTPNHTDEQIEAIALEAGVPAEVAAGMKDGTFAPFVEGLTEIAFSTPSVRSPEGQFSTPTMLVDGVYFQGNWTRPDLVTKAVDDALGNR